MPLQNYPQRHLYCIPITIRVIDRLFYPCKSVLSVFFPARRFFGGRVLLHRSLFMFCQPPLSIDRRHTAAAGCCDRLTIILIRNIACCEYPFDIRFG